jgi:hypothetical protein
MSKKCIKSNNINILSSERLNSALQIIKIKAHIPSYRFIMEQLAIPLSEILATKGDNASFCVYPNGDQIIIQVYGKSKASSGKLTSTIPDTLGCA